jgi:hypothetical protein
MVRVDKKTNIFNLIMNRSSTVDDFKKLYELAPEKFNLNNTDIEKLIETAKDDGRDDLVKYFESILKPTITTKILSLIREDPDKLRDFLEDKDLKTLSKEEQIN